MKRVVGLGTNLTSSIYLSSPTLSRVCYDFKKMSFVHDRYSDLIGINIYQNRPPLPPQSAQTKILDRFHPSTEILPEYWQRTDVWYFHFSLSLSLSLVISTYLIAISQCFLEGGIMIVIRVEKFMYWQQSTKEPIMEVKWGLIIPFLGVNSMMEAEFGTEVSLFKNKTRLLK
jgi:hypothetical protein